MIQTVLGPIEADQLGPTSMHEHLFVDGETWYRPPETGVMDADAGLTLASAGPLRWRYFGVRDNLRIDDAAVLADELSLARAAGASGVVDLTVIGLGRRVSLLPELAKRTGLHVMVGCGFYVHATHPDWLAAAGVDEVTQQLLNELNVGIDGTDVRAAMLGEIGTSDPIADDELKVLRAAGAAAALTGASVNVHQTLGRHGAEIVEVLTEEGVSPDRIVLSHMDDDLDPAYQLAVAETGAILGFDTFGHESYHHADRRYPTDFERLDAIRSLLEAGYVEQIVLGNDVWTKGALRLYGGMGYEHLFRRVVPMLRHRCGASLKDVDAMLTRTPRRLLARTPPQR